MRPLQITATLAAPVQGVDPIHLDALIEWAWYREHPEQDHNVSRVAPPPPPAPLPLARGSHNGVSLWLASAWIPGPNAVDWFTSRRDGRDREAPAKPFVPSAGPGRDQLLRRSVTVTQEATWQAHGDPDVVRHLLTTHVHHLGVRRRHGLGRIRSWSVDVVEEVPPWWALWAPQGHALRNLPLPWLAEWEGPAAYGAVEGPYWHPARQQPIAQAGQRVRLQEGAPEVVC